MSKDPYANPKKLITVRECLCCDTAFTSRKNNRICDTCKRTNGEHGYFVKNQKDKYANKTTGYGR